MVHCLPWDIFVRLNSFCLFVCFFLSYHNRPERPPGESIKGCRLQILMTSSSHALYPPPVWTFQSLQIACSVSVVLSSCLDYPAPFSGHTVPVEARTVTESIQEINNNSWLVGDRILLSRRCSPSPGSKWSDGKGSLIVISEAPYPLPPCRSLPATIHIQKIYDAGGVPAVCSIGDGFCKVTILDPHAKREHVTLDYLHNKSPLSLQATPDVYYHAEHDGRYYIMLSRLTGQTLSEAWPHMDEATKATLCFPSCDYLQGTGGMAGWYCQRRRWPPSNGSISDSFWVPEGLQSSKPLE